MQSATRATQNPPQRRALFAGHTRIATVTCSTAHAGADAIRQSESANAVEVRLDAIWQGVPDAERASDDLSTLVEAGQAAGIPLIATLRPRRAGGAFVGPEEVRVNLLAAALASGFAAVDVEADIVQVPGMASALRGSSGLIVSQHEFGKVPCREDGMRALLGMQDVKASLDKLAYQAGAFPDLLRAFEFTRAHALRGGRPVLAPMLHGGPETRALLALAGNRATYGHAQGSPPAGPGQPSLASVDAVWRHWGLEQADLDACAAAPSPWLAVLGTPVAHSLSPRIHNAAFRKAGRKERYGALDVPASASALRLLCTVAPRLGLAGASVTAPHKVDAVRMGEPDDIARAVGAANCLRWDGDQCKATNTDASALHRILRAQSAGAKSMLVLGAGGAARAALWAAQRLGLEATLASRDPIKGQAAAAALDARWIPWAEAATQAPDVIVQATPDDSNHGFLLPLLARRPVVIELAYGSGPSGLLAAANRAGCPTVSPLTMLVEQAVDAYRFWFGAEPHRHVMDGAISA